MMMFIYIHFDKGETMELIVAKNMRQAFQNMFNLYAHELSQYNVWLGTQINIEGNYLADAVSEYIDSDCFESYCIMEDNIPIGMAVFSSSLEEGEWYHDIEEIFLVNTSRHKGIIKKICLDFWNRNTGTGTLHVLAGNSKAICYWEKLLEYCKYSYQKKVKDGMVAYHFHI